MSVRLFPAVFVLMSGAAIVLGACQKENVSPSATSSAKITTPSAGAPKKNAGRILFVSNRDGNDEIYAMESDGSGNPTDI